MAIERLSSTDSVAAGDQVPIYSASAGGDRKVPLSLLAAYIQAQLTAATTEETQYASPNATGFSVAIAPTTDGNSVFLLLTPLAGYAAGTIVLPALAECLDGQELLVTCTQTVTALTVDGNGATVNGAPTTLAANAFFRLRFDAINESWYRVG